MMRALYILCIFSVAFLLLAPPVSLAVPQLTSVHGKLSDVSGNPITGNFDFIFKIYSVESGGTPLWTEYWNSTNEQVSIGSGGYFSVLLGSHTAINLPFDQQYWLSIQVANDLLSPRFKMGSTPYTYRANITENLAAGTKAAGTLNMNNYDITSAGNIYGATLYEGGTALSSKYTLQTRTLTAGSGLSGGGTLAADRTFSLNYGTDLLGWSNLTSYPAGCGAGQAIQSVGDTLTCVDLNSTSGNVSGTGTSGYVSRFTGAGTIGNSIIYDSGTNIGIGTAGPNYPLQVHRNADGVVIQMTNNNAAVGTGSSNGTVFAFSGAPSPNNGNFQILNFHNRSIEFYTNYNGGGTSPRMVIDNSGNVGIGTTSPVVKLDVRGAISTSNAAGTAASPIYIQDPNTAIHRISNGAGDVSGDLQSFGTFTSATAALGLIGHSEVVLGTTNNGDKTTLIVNSNGNVGIGTTAPGALLEVAASGTASSVKVGQVRLQSLGVNDGYYLNNLYYTGSVWKYGGTGYGIGLLTSTGEFSFYTAPSGTSGADATLTERMRLSNTGGLSLGSTYVGTNPGAGNLIVQGNLGIGTTSPSSKLHVNGTIVGGMGTPTSGDISSRSMILTDRTGSSGISSLGFEAGSTYRGDFDFAGSTGDMRWWLWNGSSWSNTVSILGNGNVGIGTTSPSSKLEVAGTLNATSGGSSMIIDANGDIKVGI